MPKSMQIDRVIGNAKSTVKVMFRLYQSEDNAHRWWWHTDPIDHLENTTNRRWLPFREQKNKQTTKTTFYYIQNDVSTDWCDAGRTEFLYMSNYTNAGP